MTQTHSRPRNTAERGILVASVPANHVYIHHVAAEQPDGVTRLADPHPDDPRRSAQEAWWPPVMLDPDWIAGADFDVFHLQFGFDAWSTQRLSQVVTALRGRGKPFVYTVHDLRNPHHQDRSLHDSQLDVLVPAADAILTLTTGAAREIAERWDRTAFVVPHPHIVDFATMGRLGNRARTDGKVRIGLHVKSLRASMDPVRLLPPLLDFARRRPDVVLQVNGHRDVLEPGGARFNQGLARALRDAEAAGLVDLRVHDFMPDAELFDYLASLDVAVLPYRFGTHSGWLEACRDLGTTVVAPSCGYYADQGPVLTYVNAEETFDPDSLEHALEEAVANPALGRLTVEERREQRARISAFHAGLYDDLISCRAARSG
jgi:glycosyltransferase involved in cell wall biosynthesis